MGNQWKYVPLVQYLCGLPPEQDQATLSLVELEILVGSLPPTAQQPRFWHDETARRNWQRYGFTATLDPTHGTVTFTRVAALPAEGCALCMRPALGDYTVTAVGRQVPPAGALTGRRPLCQYHIGRLRWAGSHVTVVRHGGRRYVLALAELVQAPQE